MGHGDDARPLADLAVEAGRVTDGVAGILADRSGHELGGSAGCEPSRDEQQYLAMTPILVDQGRGDLRRLASARRGDEQRAAVVAKRPKQLRQDGVDREFHVLARQGR